jgi:hypothetical protein
MPDEPAAAVVRFIYGDTVDPGAQAAPLAEGSDSTEDFYKNLLNHITGFRLVAHQPVNDAENGLLVTPEEFFVCFLDAGSKSAQNARIFVRNSLLGARQDG